MKVAEVLLEQISKNTSNLSDLHDRVEYRVGKHVDVREALLKQKDEQLQILQRKMDDRIEVEAEEQKKLMLLIESLEKQLRERDSNLKEQEKQLNLDAEKLEHEKRKFYTEKEITMSHLEEEHMKIKQKEMNLAKERKHLGKAMEAEHQKIVSSKMKLAVNRKINNRQQICGQSDDTGKNDEQEEPSLLHLLGGNQNGNDDGLQMEMNALAEAFQHEEAKLKRKKEHAEKFEANLNARKQKLNDRKKVSNNISLKTQLVYNTISCE